MRTPGCTHQVTGLIFENRNVAALVIDPESGNVLGTSARRLLELFFRLRLHFAGFGYDGKGQKVLRAPEDVAGTFDELGGVPLISGWSN